MGMGLALFGGRDFQMFFVDDGGAGEEVVPELTTFIEEEGAEVEGDCNGEEKEEGEGFDASAKDATEEGDGAEIDGVDGAEPTGAFPEGSCEEGFPEGEVCPESEELNFGCVAEGFEERVVWFGKGFGGRVSAIHPNGELLDPCVEFEVASGVRLRKGKFPNDEGGDRATEDEVEQESEGANAEPRGGHGTAFA